MVSHPPIWAFRTPKPMGEMLRVHADDPRIRLAHESESRFHAPPSQRELLGLAVFSAVVMWVTAFLLHRSPNLTLQYGDNPAYLAVANAILRWDFHNVGIQHFMGYPYFIAAVSRLFHVPTVFSLADRRRLGADVGLARGPFVRDNRCRVFRAHKFRMASGFVPRRIRASGSGVGPGCVAGFSAGSRFPGGAARHRFPSLCAR